MTNIHLRGVRVHNLKNIDVDLPLGKLTVISGVTGAGKGSLACDTLYAEAQRRFLQNFSPAMRPELEQLDKPAADGIGSLPPPIAIGPVVPVGPFLTVGTMSGIVQSLRLLFSRFGTVVCIGCNQEIRAQNADDVLAAVEQLPEGTRFSVAFPSCPDPGSNPADWVAALREQGFLRLQIGSAQVRLDEKDFPHLGNPEKIRVLIDRLEAGKGPPQRVSDAIETAFARGHGRMALVLDDRELLFDRRLRCPRCHSEFLPPDPRQFSFDDPLGACPACSGSGIDPKTKHGCTACKGTRMNEKASGVRLGGLSIAQLCAMSAAEMADFLGKLGQIVRQQPAGKSLLEQITARVDSLQAVGIGYLSLDRALATLSTGEAHRLQLAALLNSKLTNVLVVLDEPSAGLHPQDTAKVVNVLHRLRDAGNTLVAIENKPEIIVAADYLVDLGPGAGEEGGQVVYQGLPSGLADCATSMTGAYLAGRRSIRMSSTRRQRNQGSIRLAGAQLHNLQNLTVDFPLGVLCVVTGVSGAGKSSLVQHTLYPALCRTLNKKLPPGVDVPEVEIQVSGQIGDVVLLDQSPLVRSARSNPATFLKIFDDIRQIFAETSEARQHGLGPGTFSFNQSGGRCDTCEGQGTLALDLPPLPGVHRTCPACQGTRFKPEVLQVKVNHLNIAQVLHMTVREAFRFFRAQPLIERRLKILFDVGLDYLPLGQPADTLSGSECQCLKLAGHLAFSKKPRCLFILCEPTTGLHMADVERLLECFDRLLATGNSLIVTEHNRDVIQCADHVIELGPGAGASGGRIVAAGTPEEIGQGGKFAEKG
jgi:excinuclease ABC subunit A